MGKGDSAGKGVEGYTVAEGAVAFAESGEEVCEKGSSGRRREVGWSLREKDLQARVKGS